MIVLKFIILSIALFCSILIGIKLIITLMGLIAAMRNKASYNTTGTSLLWFLVCAMAWAAYIVFF